MARNEDSQEPRRQLLEVLLAKVAEDTYPSGTMLDIIEEMLTEDEVAEYSAVLIDKIKDENYPSLPMIDRLRNLPAFSAEG